MPYENPRGNGKQVINLRTNIVSSQDFPIGQRVLLPGHFGEPVLLEAVRAIGAGYECRVRLPDGTPDEAILSNEEAAALSVDNLWGYNDTKVVI